MQQFTKCGKCGGYIPELRFGGVNIYDCKNHTKLNMIFKDIIDQNIGCKRCKSLSIETRGMSRRCLDCGNTWIVKDSGIRLDITGRK